MAVKIDMEKAFDRMEWDFLLLIMLKLGFHPTWVNWIRICVSSTSFLVLINGSPFGLFTPTRGLRQGDPLSPFLFILGTKVLSRLFLQQESIGLLKGIKIARSCAPINHLLFTDDLIIFAKATSAEATVLTSCLHKYCLWSGQKVNNEKSYVLFSKNTSHASISSILGIIPYRLVTSAPFYLGLPLGFGSSRKEAFQPLLDKVLSKINGWRAKTLSQAGRTVLLKATAAAIPTYAMSTFLLPSSFCRTLDRRFKDFWWGFPPDKCRNLSLKSWDSICLPRNQGGLGLRKMSTTNLALITKLGWKFLHTNSLWVHHLHKNIYTVWVFLFISFFPCCILALERSTKMQAIPHFRFLFEDFYNQL
jgi:hypothetical protein